MNWEDAIKFISALGGIAVILGLIDAKYQQRERNRAIEESWQGAKKDGEDHGNN